MSEDDNRTAPGPSDATSSSGQVVIANAAYQDLIAKLQEQSVQLGELSSRQDRHEENTVSPAMMASIGFGVICLTAGFVLNHSADEALRAEVADLRHEMSARQSNSGLWLITKDEHMPSGIVCADPSDRYSSCTIDIGQLMKEGYQIIQVTNSSQGQNWVEIDLSTSDNDTSVYARVQDDQVEFKVEGRGGPGFAAL